MHATTAHHRERVDAIRADALSDWVPPIQLRPSGQPISVTDQVVGAIVLSVALVAIAKITSFSVTTLL